MIEEVQAELLKLVVWLIETFRDLQIQQLIEIQIKLIKEIQDQETYLVDLHNLDLDLTKAMLVLILLLKSQPKLKLKLLWRWVFLDHSVKQLSKDIASMWKLLLTNFLKTVIDLLA